MQERLLNINNQLALRYFVWITLKSWKKGTLLFHDDQFSVSYTNEIVKWYRKIRSCSSTEDALQVLVYAANDLEFEYVAYGLQTRLPITKPKTILLNNYPQGWKESYENNNYVNIDPTVKYALQSTQPIKWASELFSDCPKFREEAVAYGIDHGITQPIHSQKCYGLLSLSRPKQHISKVELWEKQETITFLTHAVHSFVSSTILTSIQPECNVALTVREVDILR